MPLMLLNLMVKSQPSSYLTYLQHLIQLRISSSLKLSSRGFLDPKLSCGPLPCSPLVAHLLILGSQTPSLLQLHWFPVVPIQARDLKERLSADDSQISLSLAHLFPELLNFSTQTPSSYLELNRFKSKLLPFYPVADLPLFLPSQSSHLSKWQLHPSRCSGQKP